MATLTDGELSELLRAGDFDELFLRMGWDNSKLSQAQVDVKESDLKPVPIKDKRLVTAWHVRCPQGLPGRAEQHRVVRELKKRSSHQLVVFSSDDEHLWLWPEQRPSGVGYRLVDHPYRAEKPTEAVLQRLRKASFTVREEPTLTGTEVLKRVRLSFNAEKVTKAFYQEFQKHHKAFAGQIEGLADDSERSWYASVLLNRLMFVYFIQQKGFMDGDPRYLTNRLKRVQDEFGDNQFYSFFRRFLLPLFHEALGKPDADREIGEPIKSIIGDIPYINGGIFEPHQFERTGGEDIRIPDKAFEKLFKFFNAWRWHLEERPTERSDEINPDVLGYIFEQYVNFTESGQKKNGAYYTKPDITGYMAASTILPAVADRLVAAGLDNPGLLLGSSGDNYIHDSILHGVDEELPEEIDGESEPPDELALPGERWCDITHRRDKCAKLRSMLNDAKREWGIDDAITYNLDLRELMADYLSQLGSAEECDLAFEVLRKLTVCDPMVGSGAFLFAALEVLDPLYESVLFRASELQERNPRARPAKCLLEAQGQQGETRSETYWRLKTLCLNNLFGVDIMDEAIEIAKLRLFLKLAAQIEDASQLEPLPDLDFNIKAGNSLVGIAHEGDFNTRLGAGGGSQPRLGAEAVFAELELLARDTARAYGEFVAAQAAGSANSDHVEAKQTLRAQIDRARRRADGLLWQARGETEPVKSWLQSHRPFHWFVEFPSVWQRGGFDVVLGNPPYIQIKKVTGYRWEGYATQKCPDLYAICMERASSLLRKNGRMSMIVMHSLCFSKFFLPLREYLRSRFPRLWMSSYALIPSCLFSGSAKVRNSIVVAACGGEERLRTSSCRRWQAVSRPQLFEGIDYASPSTELLKVGNSSSWPFVESKRIADAMAKLCVAGEDMHSHLNPSGRYPLRFKKTGRYFLNIADKPAPVEGPSGEEWGYMRYADRTARDLSLLMLAGLWGYVWWLMQGDEFHLTKGVLTTFPSDVGRLCAMAENKGLAKRRSKDAARVERLLALAKFLKKEMPRRLAWKKNGPGLVVGRYNMLKCRHITDEADLLLAQLWGIEDAYEAAVNWRDRMVFGNKDDAE